MKNTKLFKDWNPTIFNWKDLDGKDLKIHVGVDFADGKDCTIVMGYEKKTGNYYLLNEETKMVVMDELERRRKSASST